MAVDCLDHVNICTPDVERAAAFFADILGMAVIPAAVIADPTRALWVCDAAGKPVIHLNHPSLYRQAGLQAGADADVFGSGRIHHVALRCSDHAKFQARLKSAGVDFQFRESRDIQLKQIFVNDIHGICMELNFFE